MSTGAAYKGKLALGANTVGSVNKWALNGMVNDTIDATVFADEFKKFVTGQGNGGKVTFSGFFDAADTSGQTALRTVWVNKTTLATGTTNDPRLYYSATGYLELSASAECLVEEMSIGEADISGMVPFSATLQVSGGYFQVHA